VLPFTRSNLVFKKIQVSKWTNLTTLFTEFSQIFRTWNWGLFQPLEDADKHKERLDAVYATSNFRLWKFSPEIGQSGAWGFLHKTTKKSKTFMYQIDFPGDWLSNDLTAEVNSLCISDNDLLVMENKYYLKWEKAEGLARVKHHIQSLQSTYRSQNSYQSYSSNSTSNSSLALTGPRCIHWNFFNDQVPSEGKCENYSRCHQHTVLSVVCKCKKVKYCSVKCQEQDQKYHFRRCANAQEEIS
jgi:hypothetical protein